MEFTRHITRMSALALGIAGALACGQANAAAFQLKENSAKAQGRAMAGAASAKGDASVVVNNPAVMSTFERTTIQGDVTGVDLSFRFNGGGTAAYGTPLQQPLTGGNGGDAGGLAAVPAFSVVMPLSGQFEYVTLGAMVSAPFGLKTEYENGWAGRYHALTSDLKFVDLTLAGSLDVTDKFSVGLGVIIQRSEATLTNAVDFGAGICRINAALCVTPNPVTAPFGPQKNDGVASIEGTDTGFGWSAGLNYRPTDNVSLGYAYRSEVDHELRGDATFDVPANVKSLLAVAAPGMYTDGKGGARLTLPSTHTLSATWDINDRFSVMAEGVHTGWDSLREVRIEFDNPVQPDAVENYSWHDSWFYSLGGEYRASDRFTYRAGVGRDESPVAFQHRTPRMPDQDRNWYSIGMTWTVNDNFEVSGSYVRIQMADTPEVDIISSSGSRLVGSYRGGADLYGISAQYRF